jgi:hypothetical protein
MAFSAPDGYGIEISMHVRIWMGVWRTYTELDWDREEIATSFFCDGVATSDTWKIDECWLYDAFLSLCCLHEAFSEAEVVR